MRKKFVSIMVVSIVFMMLLTACGADQASANTQDETKVQAASQALEEADAEDQANQEINLSGGWSVSDKSDITEEQKAVFDKATEALCGATYTPVAYLGSQVVAGTNHAFLCRTSASVEELNSESWWTIVYIYEDLEGKCEIIDTKEIELGISESEES